MTTSSLSSLNLGREVTRRSDIVYDRIRTAIATGEIQPGERLRQEALAQDLGVSQSTVREAINRLIAEGLADEEPYKGVKTVVLPLEAQVDVIEIRIALECMAMESAARCISEADLERMRNILPRTAEHEGNSAAAAWEANREFHWIAIEASGRRHLIRLLTSIWNLTNHYILFARSESTRRRSAEYIIQEHTELIDRLSARDGFGAVKVTKRSLLRGLQMAEQELAGRKP